MFSVPALSFFVVPGRRPALSGRAVGLCHRTRKITTRRPANLSVVLSYLVSHARATSSSSTFRADTTTRAGAGPTEPLPNLDRHRRAAVSRERSCAAWKKTRFLQNCGYCTHHKLTKVVPKGEAVMDEFSRRDEAIRELCAIIKACMEAANKLSAGGPDIPRLVANFDAQVSKLRGALSDGEIAQVIDAELSQLSKEPALGFDDVDRNELRRLIAAEFQTCANYHLDRFVSVKSIFRAVLKADTPDTKPVAVHSSKELAEILGKNAHAYQAQLTAAREPTSLPHQGKKPPSARIEKKKRKRNIYSGIYNTLAGIAFITCNTATLAMKTSAKFASDHFRSASKELFPS